LYLAHFMRDAISQHELKTCLPHWRVNCLNKNVSDQIPQALRAR
jgi:hypothetical protein